MSKGFLYDEGDDLITRKEDVGGLPDTSEASAGDVLSLDSDKDPVWSAPSGGGGCDYLIAPIISDDNTTNFRVYFWDKNGEPISISTIIANYEKYISIADAFDVSYLGDFSWSTFDDVTFNHIFRVAFAMGDLYEDDGDVKFSRYVRGGDAQGTYTATLTASDNNYIVITQMN